MWNYATADDAFVDALRLSEGMSNKNAMADLPLGGGKAVIWGNAKTDKTPELFRALGRAIAPHEAVETVDSYMQFLKARQSEQSQGAEGAGTELDA